MERRLRRVESVVSRDDPDFGRKARGLAKLARAGFPVPAAWALSSAAFFEAVDAQRSDGSDSSTLPGSPLRPELLALASSSTTHRRLIAPLAPWLRRGLGEVFDDLQSRGAQALAVRSSSPCEDGYTHSGAGAFVTVLGVRSKRALAAAVRTCWESAFSPRAIALYAQMAGEETTISPWGMGVVIQAMVPAEVSGVLFTANPMSGDVHEMVINASYGLGGPVVDGTVSPDTYWVSRNTKSVRDRVLGDKTVRLVSDLTVDHQQVPADLRSRYCLASETIAALAEVGERIEQRFGNPQDVEWSIANGKLYVLQARPISALAHKRGSSPRRLLRSRKRFRPSSRDTTEVDPVWSNVNVGEALPGVVTPLTWSILSGFSESGFRHVLRSVGCSVPKDSNFVGNVRGRVYLNISGLADTLSQLPGITPDILSRLGGGAFPGLEGGPQGSWLRPLTRSPIVILRLLQGGLSLRPQVDAHTRQFEREREHFRNRDLRVLSPGALGKTLRDLERLLESCGIVLLSCYARLLVHAVILLRTMPMALRSAERDRGAILLQGLFSGIQGVISAHPAQEMSQIAALAREQPAMVTALRETEQLPRTVGELPAGEARERLSDFLRQHGHRGPREAELAEPRWNEDPALLLSTLRAMIGRGKVATGVAAGRRCSFAKELREDAERELAQSVAPGRLLALRPLIRGVRNLTRLRETLRDGVVETLGMIRKIALEADRRLCAARPGAQEGDVFFLTLHELYQALEDSALAGATPVAKRRAQYRHYRSLPNPPTTFRGLTMAEPETSSASSDGKLAGLPCSRGRAEGIVRVMEAPSDAHTLRAGEILVVPQADVGWTPLFVAAAAVVTELGGPLSHASVVAREIAVPMVANVTGATRTLRTGDRVIVDGDQGTVKRLGERRP